MKKANYNLAYLLEYSRSVNNYPRVRAKSAGSINSIPEAKHKAPAYTLDNLLERGRSINDDRLKNLKAS